MASSIGTMALDLIANTRGFKRDMKGAQGAVSSFSRNAVRSAMSAAAAFISLRGAMSAARAAMVQIAAENKVAAVLKATGNAAGFTAKQLNELAKARQKLTNFGDEETLGGIAVLATFKSIKGNTFTQAVTAMQDMATVMGGDLVGAAKMLGKVLADPIARMGELSRVGVILSATQKQQIKDFIEVGNKAAAAQVILDELVSEMGGAAEAVADPLTQATNDLGDAWERLGETAIPVLTKITQATTLAAGGVKDYVDWWVKAGKFIGRYLVQSEVSPGDQRRKFADYEARQRVQVLITRGKQGGLMDRAASAAAAAVNAHITQRDRTIEDARMARLASTGHNLALAARGLRGGGQALGGLSNRAGGGIGRIRQFLADRQSRGEARADAMERARARAITGTPESDLRDRIGFLKGARNAGVITPGEFAIESQNAQKQFARSRQQGVTPTLTTALIKGSQQAYNAIARFSQRQTDEKLLLRAQQDTLAEAKKIATNTEPVKLEIPPG